MLLDIVFVVVLSNRNFYLYSDFGQKSNGSVISVGLLVDVKERLLLGSQTALLEHLTGVKRFAHCDFLKMLDIAVEKLLVLLRVKDSSTEISYLHHLSKFFYSS